MRDPKDWLTGVLRHQPSRGENTSSINKSLLGLGPPGHLATYWGPMVVVSNVPGQASPTDGAQSVAHFKDLGMQDVWTTIAFLTYGDKKSPCLVNDPRAPLRSLPSIKINCVGDRIRFHPDKDPDSDAAIYEAVTVPNGEPFPEKSQWPSILAVMMGLPWLCRVVYNSSNLWAKDPNGDYSVTEKALVANPELGHLHAFLQTASRENFVAPAHNERVIKALCLSIEPSPHYGSVILVNMYGELIPPEHVKMVNMFAEERGFGTSGLKETTLTGFGEYWDQKQRENNVPGMDLRGVPSPYAGRGLPHPRERCVENLDLYNSLFKEVGEVMSLPRAFVWTDESVSSG
ncbi:hypothetical protein F5883DRAFT_653270 [Diaporthe sp. PMI_573]|nr:hypothetical protein F5883DRAFT_653270 [Diaporthaceae sp. PMI_573]